MDSADRCVLMVSQPTVAGVAQCVLDWSTGLHRKGWRVVAACPTDGWLATKLQAAGIEVHPWDSQRSPTAGLVGESRLLQRIVADTRPDVILLHSSKAGLVGRLVTRGRTPTVFAPHSWSFEAAHGATAAAALRWERFAARWTHRFLCVSDAERDLGIGSGVRGSYVIARNGIDVTSLKPPADRQSVRRSLGLEQVDHALVCVGRLCEQKGQDVLLQAWPEIAGTHRTLTFVGDGPDLDRLRGQTHDPRVRFLGGMDRQVALDWLAAADLVVLPSRWEGMALVPLEALAVGSPVVATDVNGAREAITPEVGAVCPPEDPGALASAVNQWLSNTERNMEQVRAACRDRAVSAFDVEKTIGILDNTLNAVSQESR